MNGGQPLWIGLISLRPPPQLPGDVAHLRQGRPQALGEIAQVVVGAELCCCHAEKLGDDMTASRSAAARRIWVVEQGSGRVGAEPERIGRRENLLLALEASLLLRVTELGGCYLADLERQQIGLSAQLPGVAPKLFQTGIQIVQPSSRAVDFGAVKAPEAIEGSPLCLDVEEGLVGVLTVQIHQARPERLERGGCRHAPVDVGPGPAIGRNLPPDDDLRLVARQLACQDDEATLYDGTFGAVTDERRAGPAPDEQLERLHHEGLARTRLARERRHGGAEVQVQVLDDPEVADLDLRQHRPQRSESEKRDRRTAEVAAAEGDEARIHLARATHDGISLAQSEAARAVYDEGSRASLQQGERDRLVGREHKGAVEDDVGSDRSQDYCAHRGRDDGAAS